ncbi:Hypothetical predicted protein [Cloeon dipterum]|uniref:Uncharacterized protein n=1 Tax=Cloeon dipterum TaxID=197152 RepID=A0A8S1DYH1_9INSE|nr:Hypothetical predicted protein [Cloeon dipterum]
MKQERFHEKNEVPKTDFCGEGTFEEENGSCAPCKSYMARCKLDKECCDDNKLQCTSNSCRCPFGLEWSFSFEKRCVRSYPTIPPITIDDDVDFSDILFIVSGILGGLLSIITVFKFCAKCYSTSQQERSDDILNEPSAAFSPSAPTSQEVFPTSTTAPSRRY